MSGNWQIDFDKMVAAYSTSKRLRRKIAESLFHNLKYQSSNIQCRMIPLIHGVCNCRNPCRVSNHGNVRRTVPESVRRS